VKLASIFNRGILKENPLFVLVLGLCPSLAVTTSVTNAVGMGAAVIFVLTCSNTMVSLFRNFFPAKVRIPCFIIVISTFVTIVQKIMQAFFPALDESLGIFIPLIVVNCVILGRAEAFASRNGVLSSALDGLGMGLGFTIGLVWVSLFREVLGTWEVAGIPISMAGKSHAAAVLIMAPGAFLVLGLSLAFFRMLGGRKAGLLTTAVARASLAEEPPFGPPLVKEFKAKAAATAARKETKKTSDQSEGA
jgi:H+/Na+-translocating ferredoxin:NAD+ oxidoreductase subunit E